MPDKSAKNAVVCGCATEWIPQKAQYCDPPISWGTHHEKGNAARGNGNVRSITDLIRSEAALKESGSRYRDLVDSAQLMIQSVNPDGTIPFVNRTWLAAMGYSESEVTNLNIFQLLHPESLPRCREAFSKIMAGDRVEEIRATFMNKSGNPVYVEGSASPRIVNENVVGTHAVFRDVTSRKRAQEALKASHRFLEIANKHLAMLPLLEEFVMEIKNTTACQAVGIRLLDEKGNIPYQAHEGFSPQFYAAESPLSIHSDQCMCINVIKGTADPSLPFFTKSGSFYMNGTTRFLTTVSEADKGKTRNMCNKSGFESVALVPIHSGDRILGLIHVADPKDHMVPLKVVNEMEGAAMQLGTALHRVLADEMLRKAHGELELRIEARTAQLTDVNLRLTREASERRRAENALRRSETELMTIFHSAPFIMILVDGDGRVHKSNAAAWLFAGRREEEMTGLRYGEALGCLHSHDAPEGCGCGPACASCPVRGAAADTFETGRSRHNVEDRLAFTQNGQSRELDLLISTTLLTLPESPRVLVSMEDITARKQAEKGLRESEERYRILTENVADGVGIFQNRKLVFVNHALVAISGYSENRLLSADPITLFRHDHRESYRKMLEAFEKGAPVESFKALCIHANGREIWVEGHNNAIEWKGSPAIIFTVRDITERHLRQLAMEEEKERLRKENIRLRSSIKERYRFGDIIGKSPAMQELYELILKASAADVNAVVSGESGTGKDLIARTIHHMSARRDKAFVPVNCGAIPESLFESEFFGHRKGAFTGAHADKHGFFDYAHEGTLFLDEVGELTLNMQVKLLRAVEGGGYTPIGDNQIRKADFHIIAATNRELPRMIEQGRMREDFFYRIHVIPITVPPLRERKEDIPLLVDHFLRSHNNGKKGISIPGKIMDALCRYDWPGNIRELQNTLHRYLVVGRLDFIISSAHASAKADDALAGKPRETCLNLHAAVEDVEKSLIGEALKKYGWNRSNAAKELGISRKTLFRKMKDFGL